MDDKLGYTYVDKVTGFKGVATGSCTYLSGCSQLLLAPRVGENGEHKDPQWFDVQRLDQLLSEGRVVLDNGANPGLDRPAPKR